jgi:hypothetical protein
VNELRVWVVSRHVDNEGGEVVGVASTIAIAKRLAAKDNRSALAWKTISPGNHEARIGPTDSYVAERHAVQDRTTP